MGHRLVDQAFTFVAAHNERARASGERSLEALEVALLVRMAHRAVDDAALPEFFERRSDTCRALGVPDTEPGRKRIQRALSALADAGAITRPSKVVRGFTPRYSLNYQGGAQASTLSPEVWTPEHPHNSGGMDARAPEVWTPEPRSMDAWAPPEEKEQKEEERERASAFELLTPSIPTAHAGPQPWDADLPEPLTASEAARCPAHPHGTTDRCGACGENRRTWLSRQRATRTRRPVTPRLVLVEGRRVCADGNHTRATDGSCINCEIRAEDLARPIGATA